MNPTFVKLLMMTTSPHDGEALTAIRKANAILAEANVNWEEFLTAVSSAQAQPGPPPRRREEEFTDVGRPNRYDNARDIDRMFARAFTISKGSFRSFVRSLHTWWKDHGYLTPRQYDALRKAAR